MCGLTPCLLCTVCLIEKCVFPSPCVLCAVMCGGECRLVCGLLRVCVFVIGFPSACVVGPWIVCVLERERLSGGSPSAWRARGTTQDRLTAALPYQHNESTPPLFSPSPSSQLSLLTHVLFVCCLSRGPVVSPLFPLSYVIVGRECNVYVSDSVCVFCACVYMCV